MPPPLVVVVDYWQDVIAVLKEKRKFLDEYKALLSTRRRLIE